MKSSCRRCTNRATILRVVTLTLNSSTLNPEARVQNNPKPSFSLGLQVLYKLGNQLRDAMARDTLLALTEILGVESTGQWKVTN